MSISDPHGNEVSSAKTRPVVTSPDDGTPMVACGNCWYWDVNKLIPLVGAKQCRRMPPVAMDKNGRGGWPATGRDNWCGEFKPCHEAEAFMQQRLMQDTEKVAKETGLSNELAARLLQGTGSIDAAIAHWEQIRNEQPEVAAKWERQSAEENAEPGDKSGA